MANSLTCFTKLMIQEVLYFCIFFLWRTGPHSVSFHPWHNSERIIASLNLKWVIYYGVSDHISPQSCQDSFHHFSYILKTSFIKHRSTINLSIYVLFIALLEEILMFFQQPKWTLPYSFRIKIKTIKICYEILLAWIVHYLGDFRYYSLMCFPHKIKWSTFYIVWGWQK